VRFGETTKAALKRELSEEIDIDCTIGELALIHKNLFGERGIKPQDCSVLLRGFVG